ncbi:MAG: TonB-dependent receptor [Bacteroidota bacterium]
MSRFLKYIPDTCLKGLLLFIVTLLGLAPVMANPSNQTVRGVVYDKDTKIPLIGATVVVLDTEPVLGGVTDENGVFTITNVPIGRQDISVSYIGYDTYIQREVLVKGGEELLLEFYLTESAYELGEVVVTSNDREVMNEAAVVSARSLQVEELTRIPGGIDDPARLVRKFPGVSPSPVLTSNEINIRGNASRTVLWRLDDIDIYNPNHFGVIGGSGGGLTIFSQRLLTNTDFYSGAFPADYGNAIGGIFDVRFRNGNTKSRQHSIQLSVLGIDFATEGPFSKQGNASYIANYRFSSTGLVEPFLNLGSLPVFQDLSFKLHFKTKAGGSFNVFGIGGISTTAVVPVKDTLAWGQPGVTNYGYQTTANTGTIGASLVHPFGDNTYLKATLVGTGLESGFKGYYLQYDLETADTSFASLDKDVRVSGQVYLNHKFNRRHTHRSGLIIHGLHSDVYYYAKDPDSVEIVNAALTDTVRFGRGNSFLVQAYSRSQFVLGDAWKLNVGLHFMYLGISQEFSIEPRFGIRYEINPKSSINFGYGLHSQMDPFYTYVSLQKEDEFGPFVGRLNDDLLFNKAHHLTLAYYYQPSDQWRLGAEVYFQYLYNLVVAVDLPISRVGGYNRRFETVDLNNGGVGSNYGIELAAERSFQNGFFAMANTSIFEANYAGNDGIRRPSQFNNGLIVNAVVGKEWAVGGKRGKANFFSLNTSFTYSGPQHYTPLDLEASIAANLYTGDFDNPNSAQQDPLLFIDASIIYKVNREKWNTQWTLQVANILNRRPVIGVFYDRIIRDQAFLYGDGVIPALSWRINF